MTTYQVLDGSGLLKYVYGLGTGTSGDPYRLVSKRYSNALCEDGKIFVHNDRHTIANGATFYYLLKTPASPIKVTLYELSISANAVPISYDFFEDAILSANGTIDLAFNNNRQIGTASATALYYTPTVTSTGTALLSDIINGDKTTGGSSTGEFRVVLKASANYLLAIINNSGVSSTIAPFIKFSET